MNFQTNRKQLPTMDRKLYEKDWTDVSRFKLCLNEEAFSDFHETCSKYSPSPCCHFFTVNCSGFYKIRVTFLEFRIMCVV